ncbi:hypothetical protein P3S67_015850 [Capsicum chacoense]
MIVTGGLPKKKTNFNICLVTLLQQPSGKMRVQIKFRALNSLQNHKIQADTTTFMNMRNKVRTKVKVSLHRVQTF